MAKHQASQSPVGQIDNYWQMTYMAVRWHTRDVTGEIIWYQFASRIETVCSQQWYRSHFWLPIFAYLGRALTCDDLFSCQKGWVKRSWLVKRWPECYQTKMGPPPLRVDKIGWTLSSSSVASASRETWLVRLKMVIDQRFMAIPLPARKQVDRRKRRYNVCMIPLWHFNTCKNTTKEAIPYHFMKPFGMNFSANSWKPVRIHREGSPLSSLSSLSSADRLHKW